MTPIERQYALKKLGITQKKIAEAEGVAEMSVSKCINDLMVSDRLMKAIAKAIGEHHALVFPKYYLRPAQRSTSKVD